MLLCSFSIQAGLDKSRLNQAIKVILQEIKNLKTKTVAPNELKKAKDYIRGKTILSLEDSSEVEDSTGSDEDELGVSAVEDEDEEGVSDAGFFSMLTGAGIGGGVGNWLVALVLLGLILFLFFIVKKKSDGEKTRKKRK